MPYYTKLGKLPRTRHTQFRRPDGALYSEELFGTEGFVGPTSTLYHIDRKSTRLNSSHGYMW